MAQEIAHEQGETSSMLVTASGGDRDRMPPEEEKAHRRVSAKREISGHCHFEHERTKRAPLIHI
jgi:hypothetical protein